LVLDRNHDGKINDGSELFGTSTTLADGSKASNGYAALQEMDTNHDGVIDKKDAAYADLQVWVDANSDGVTETGELKSLTDLGIASISTQADANLSKDNGNLIGLTSTYTTTDGANHAAADVWFVADANQAAAPTPAADPADLRSRVSSLAQALSAFSSADALAPTAPAASTPGTGGGVSSAATLAVSSMVSVMQQFDANGNQIGAAGTLANTTANTLNLTGGQTPAPGSLVVVSKPAGS
jgi:hypothetical protein